MQSEQTIIAPDLEFAYIGFHGYKANTQRSRTVTSSHLAQFKMKDGVLQNLIITRVRNNANKAAMHFTLANTKLSLPDLPNQTTG